MWLPVAKPPSFAHAFAAAGVARNFTNASIAGVSRKVTNRSPLISTAVESGPGVIDGNGATLKPVPAFAFVDERITPETKSASNTIAAFGGVAERVRDRVVEAVLQRAARTAVDVRRVAEDLAPSSSAP